MKFQEKEKTLKGLLSLKIIIAVLLEQKGENDKIARAFYYWQIEFLNKYFNCL